MILAPVLQAATTQPFAEVIAAQTSWWIVLDCAEILTVTILLVIRDLSVQNRPFDWLPILFCGSFVCLVLVQSALVGIVLVVLVGWGRATLNYGIDAWWVALAGLSLLKSLPGGQGQEGRQLWSLADWLFTKFYGNLRLDIQNQSRTFATWLVHAYGDQPETLLKDVEDFIDGSENPADAIKDKKQVKAGSKARNRLPLVSNFWPIGLLRAALESSGAV